MRLCLDQSDERRFLSMASRGSDASQRQSPRVPLHLKSTASSEANAVHRPTAKERSPKVSPRGGVLQEVVYLRSPPLCPPLMGTDIIL